MIGKDVVVGAARLSSSSSNVFSISDVILLSMASWSKLDEGIFLVHSFVGILLSELRMIYSLTLLHAVHLRTFRITTKEEFRHSHGMESTCSGVGSNMGV